MSGNISAVSQVSSVVMLDDLCSILGGEFTIIRTFKLTFLMVIDLMVEKKQVVTQFQIAFGALPTDHIRVGTLHVMLQMATFPK